MSENNENKLVVVLGVKGGRNSLLEVVVLCVVYGVRAAIKHPSEERSK